MIARVALPLPIDKTFSYLLPDELAACARPLTRVKVPFRARSLVGFVMEMEEGGKEEGLKAVQGLVDCVPLIDSACFELCEWASRHYVTPIGLALKYALSSTIKIEKYCLVRTSEASCAYLDGLTLKKACDLAGKTRVLGYLGRSLLGLTDVFTGRPVEGQARGREAGGYRATLYLAGVRDRLAFYTPLIAQALGQGRSVLMLLPDRQGAGDFFFRSFLRSFPGAVFWYASSLSEKKRAEAYFRARAEGGRLILGNKSSVFLPLADNGLVIVERPEEEEYRNEEAFKFNAVSLAMKRAGIEGVPLVLGSVAPPVEIMKAVADGDIAIEEGATAVPPPVRFAGGEKGRDRQRLMAEELSRAVKAGLDEGGSVVVYTPRKSYAAHLSCAACGARLLCPACGAAALSYQKQAETLSCGSCKRLFPYEERCPACGAGLIRFFDVGAEYVEERMKEAFPTRTVFRVTGEGERLRDPGSFEKANLGGSIIVGTQLLSKIYGLEAGRLILFGWEDILKTGGYRAREKMFQVLANLLDALRPKELLLYSRAGTFDPSLFLAPRQFYEDELEKRRLAEFPPYVRFFAINVLKRSREAGERVIAAIERLAQEAHLAREMLGPIEVKGQYGWRVILKGDDGDFSALLASLYRLPGVHIEADPLYL